MNRGGSHDDDGGDGVSLTAYDRMVRWVGCGRHGSAHTFRVFRWSAVHVPTKTVLYLQVDDRAQNRIPIFD